MGGYTRVQLGIYKSLTFIGTNGVLESKEQMDFVKQMKDTVPEQLLGVWQVKQEDFCREI